jgi:phage terminase small subunit
MNAAVAARSVVPAVPEPPAHLSDASADLWRLIVAGWELDPAQLELLTLACEARDQAEQARVELERAGSLFTVGHKGEKAHPAVLVHRDASLRFARLVRQLDLKPESAPSSPLQLRPRRSDHR